MWVIKSQLSSENSLYEVQEIKRSKKKMQSDSSTDISKLIQDRNCHDNIKTRVNGTEGVSNKKFGRSGLVEE